MDGIWPVPEEVKLFADRRNRMSGWLKSWFL